MPKIKGKKYKVLKLDTEFCKNLEEPVITSYTAN